MSRHVPDFHKPDFDYQECEVAKIIKQAQLLVALDENWWCLRTTSGREKRNSHPTHGQAGASRLQPGMLRDVAESMTRASTWECPDDVNVRSTGGAISQASLTNQAFAPYKP
ncbi:hypothetical protein GQ600_10180 [Phytophthora cactorum]|nr:hypothetical protein GQ600_10180 [Phytophthora cactorum]